MYLVVIGILALVLTLSGPVWGLVADPGWLAAAVATATLLPPAVGVVVARRVLRGLDADPEHPAVGQAAYGRGMVLIQALLAACHGGVMAATDWLPLCSRLPVVGGWPLVPGLTSLVPFLLSVSLVWVAVYPADRAVRQIAVEVYLFRGKPLRPVWSLGRFLLYNLRHQVLFILIPMLLILGASDVVLRFEPVLREHIGPYAPDAFIGLSAIIVAVIAPEILRRVWDTRRLPDSPLRDRLLVLCRRLRLRCRDILVWRSGGMIVNAAVMGVLAPLRYVLITDAMLEQMDDTKIEAVFGHEAGHVKNHHIPCFLLFALTSGCLVTLFSVYTRGLPRTNHDLYEALVVGLGVLLAMKWGLVFGWVSRRFERQADLHGVRTLALTGLPCALPCALHAQPGNPGARARHEPLCSTAAHVYSQALHEVAVLNGIRPEARSWRHSSIASRSRFVQELALDPPRQRQFERGVRLIQVAILLAAVGTALWAAQKVGLIAFLFTRLVPIGTGGS